jgi:hypothetical protein
MSILRTRWVATPMLGLVMCGVALSACTKDQTPNPSAESGGAGQFGDGSPTSTPPPDAPTSSPAPPTFPSSAEAYAQAGVAAWVGHDIARLNQLEVAGGLIHGLAGCDGCYNLAFTFKNCQGAAGSSYCLFFNEVGDELTMHLQNSLLGAPQAIVTGSTFAQITFPSDNRAYAQEALNAWLSQNDARLKLLTKNAMTSAQVDALGPNRNANWTFDHSEGAAGSSYYDWRDGAGHTLAFRFINGPPAPSTGTASQHRIVDIVYLA